MSQVSLWQLDYSAIGFSKTMTEEFNDLKKGQEVLTSRVDGIKQWYTMLKKDSSGHLCFDHVPHFHPANSE